MTPERILALALAVMLLVNAVQVFLAARAKRIALETKALTDAIKAESARIHILVNNRLTLALAQNTALMEQNEALIRRIAELTEGRPEGGVRGG